MGFSHYLVVGSLVFTIFAAYFGQSRLGHEGRTTEDQMSSDLAVGLHKAFKPGTKVVVAVSGTLTAEHPFAGKIGELIASKGFDLVTGGTSGGNMNKVRETFSKKKKDGQKSIWAPSAKEIASMKEKEPVTGKPADVDESLDPAAGDEKPQITKADKVIVLPGGPGVVQEIEKAKERKKPCFGVLNKDDEMMDDGKTPKAKLVKDALEKNGFKYVNDMDWEKDSKAIESFLGGENVKSSALNIFPGWVLAIISLGVFAVK